ncbi:LysR family transcriptional regulator, partial [Pseudomonas sp. Pseusp97]
LGVGLRTPIGLPPSVQRLDAERAGLPAMAPLGLCLHRGEAEPEAVVERLRELLQEGVAELLENPAIR